MFLPATGLLLVARYVLIGVGPRAMGRQRAERVAAMARRLMRPLHAALGPLARLLDAVTGALPFGGQGGDPDLNGKPGVEDLVDYIESQDEIDPGERAMVRSVVELGDSPLRRAISEVHAAVLPAPARRPLAAVGGSPQEPPPISR